MRKILAFSLLTIMLFTLCASAFAWTDTWVINPQNGGTFKRAPSSHAMPNSGSYWRATYISGVLGTSQGYIYSPIYGQMTHTESFKRGTERKGLEYIKTKVVGDSCYFVGSNTYGTTVKYEYHF